MGLELGVDRGLHEVRDGDSGDLDRVLEGHEQSGPGSFLRLHRQQILAVELYRAGSDLVVRLSGQDRGQGAFAGSVRTHHGVDLAAADLKVDALEDLIVCDTGVQIGYFQ